MRVLNATVVMVLFLSLRAIADPAYKPVYLYGHISSEEDKIRLRVLFYRNIIVGWGNGAEIINIPVDKNGNFSVALPAINKLARIDLEDEVVSECLLDYSYPVIEPGDSIHLEVFIKDKSEPVGFFGAFSGRGSAKFSCY